MALFGDEHLSQPQNKAMKLVSIPKKGMHLDNLDTLSNFSDGDAASGSGSNEESWDNPPLQTSCEIGAATSSGSKKKLRNQPLTREQYLSSKRMHGEVDASTPERSADAETDRTLARLCTIWLDENNASDNLGCYQ